MTDKAYIVVNKQQEHEVLEKLEKEGYLWRGTDMRPTEKYRLTDEPITIFARDDKRLTFDYRVNEAYLTDYEIEIDFDGRKESKMITGYKDIKTNGDQGYLTDYKTSNDGRKEEHMSDKYVVSQEFMNELEEWTATRALSRASNCFVDIHDIETLPIHIETWWGVNGADTENNNRLIAIIRWVNGEDVFEVEKPKKWVVRSKEEAIKGHYSYVSLTKNKKDNVHLYEEFNATRFDTKEEAQEWANSHQEVIEVEG
ncbi:MAG: hypothetical protein ACTIMJ_03735 [Weissella hellenica]|uniref:hypothetical protein n=1 Tax=Weissella hellenica TaxID=46256 RepID=UPI003F9CB8C3